MADKEKDIEELISVIDKIIKRNLQSAYEHIRAKSDAEGMQRLNFPTISGNSSFHNIYEDNSFSYNAGGTNMSDMSEIRQRRDTNLGLDEFNLEDNDHGLVGDFLLHQEKGEENKNMYINALEVAKNNDMHDAYVQRIEKQNNGQLSEQSEQLEDVSDHTIKRDSEFGMDLGDMSVEVNEEPKNPLTMTEMIPKKRKNPKKNSVGFDVHGALSNGLFENKEKKQKKKKMSDFGLNTTPFNFGVGGRGSLIQSGISESDGEVKEVKTFTEVLNNNKLRMETIEVLRRKSSLKNEKNKNDLLCSMVTHKNTALLKKKVTKIHESQVIEEEDESLQYSASQNNQHDDSLQNTNSNLKFTDRDTFSKKNSAAKPLVDYLGKFTSPGLNQNFIMGQHDMIDSDKEEINEEEEEESVNEKSERKSEEIGIKKLGISEKELSRDFGSMENELSFDSAKGYMDVNSSKSDSKKKISGDFGKQPNFHFNTDKEKTKKDNDQTNKQEDYEETDINIVEKERESISQSEDSLVERFGIDDGEFELDDEMEIDSEVKEDKEEEIIEQPKAEETKKVNLKPDPMRLQQIAMSKRGTFGLNVHEARKFRFEEAKPKNFDMFDAMSSKKINFNLESIRSLEKTSQYNINVIEAKSSRTNSTYNHGKNVFVNSNMTSNRNESHLNPDYSTVKESDNSKTDEIIQNYINSNYSSGNVFGKKGNSDISKSDNHSKSGEDTVKFPLSSNFNSNTENSPEYQKLLKIADEKMEEYSKYKEEEGSLSSDYDDISKEEPFIKKASGQMPKAKFSFGGVHMMKININDLNADDVYRKETFGKNDSKRSLGDDRSSRKNTLYNEEQKEVRRLFESDFYDSEFHSKKYSVLSYDNNIPPSSKRNSGYIKNHLEHKSENPYDKEKVITQETPQDTPENTDKKLSKEQKTGDRKDSEKITEIKSGGSSVKRSEKNRDKNSNYSEKKSENFTNTISQTNRSSDLFSIGKFGTIVNHNYDTNAFNTPKSTIHASETLDNKLSNSINPYKRSSIGDNQSPIRNKQGSEVEELDITEWVRTSNVNVPVIREDKEVELERMRLQQKRLEEKKIREQGQRKSEELVKRLSTRNLASKKGSTLFKISEINDLDSRSDYQSEERFNRQSLLESKESNINVSSRTLSKKKTSEKLPNLIRIKGNISTPQFEKPNFQISRISQDKFDINVRQSMEHFRRKVSIQDDYKMKKQLLKLEATLFKKKKKAMIKPFLIISMIRLFNNDSRVNILKMVLNKIILCRLRDSFDVVYKYAVEYIRMAFIMQRMARKQKKKHIVDMFKLLKEKTGSVVQRAQKKRIRQSNLNLFVQTINSLIATRLFDACNHMICSSKIIDCNSSGNRYGNSNARSMSKKLKMSVFMEGFDNEEQFGHSARNIPDGHSNISDIQNDISNYLSRDRQPDIMQSRVNPKKPADTNIFNFIGRKNDVKKEEAYRKSIRLSNVQGSELRKKNSNYLQSYNKSYRESVDFVGSMPRNSYNPNEPTYIKRGNLLGDNLHVNRQSLQVPRLKTSLGRARHSSSALLQPKNDLIMQALNRINTQIKTISNPKYEEIGNLEEYILKKLFDILGTLKHLETKNRNGQKVEKEELDDINKQLQVLVQTLNDFNDTEETKMKFKGYIDKIGDNIRHLQGIRAAQFEDAYSPSHKMNSEFTSISKTINKLSHNIINRKRNSVNPSTFKSAFGRDPPVERDRLTSSAIRINQRISEPMSEYQRNKQTKLQNLLILVNFTVKKKRKRESKVFLRNFRALGIYNFKYKLIFDRLDRLYFVSKLNTVRKIALWKKKKTDLVRFIIASLRNRYRFNLKKGFKRLRNADKDMISMITPESRQDIVNDNNNIISNSTRLILDGPIREVEGGNNGGFAEEPQFIKRDDPKKFNLTIQSMPDKAFIKYSEEEFYFSKLEKEYNSKVTNLSKSINLDFDKERISKI